MVTASTIVSWFERRRNVIVKNDFTDFEYPISRPRAVDDAGANDVTFLNKKYEAEALQILLKTNCRLILVDQDIIDDESRGVVKDGQKVLILSKDPKLDFMEMCGHFFQTSDQLSKPTVHVTAIISPYAVLGQDIIIKAGVIVEDKVRIGDNCIIGENTVLKNNTLIENNVIIGSNNVIGGDGFGYVKDDKTDTYKQFPHYGGVLIRSGVEIGNNTCIDRGSLKDTVINEGVKIDNLVHIAHNVNIGENSLIIAGAMIAGSVTIGSNCWIAPCTVVRNGISIGNNCTIGLASTVTRSVSDNQTVLGSPAMNIQDFLLLRKLEKEKLHDQD